MSVVTLHVGFILHAGGQKNTYRVNVGLFGAHVSVGFGVWQHGTLGKLNILFFKIVCPFRLKIN